MNGLPGAAPEEELLSPVNLGAVLCFVAGAINAGGFLAVGMYTSHMSGVVSAMADNAVLGQGVLVWIGLWAWLSRFHPDRQFWHDQWSGTRLIDVRPGLTDGHATDSNT